MRGRWLALLLCLSVCLPAAVRHAYGMDMLALHDRVHEVGAYYQAHLATNLRAFGIEVVLDQRTEAAKKSARASNSHQDECCWSE